MALDEQDIEEFIARLHDDPQLRDRVRNAILADDFLALPGIVERLADEVRQLSAHLTRLSLDVAELTRAQEAALSRLDRVEGRLGNLDGWRFEHRYIENLGARLGLYFRKATKISLGDVDQVYDAVESGRLADADFQDLFNVDFVAKGEDVAGDRQEVYIAGELSIVVDDADVERASRRASALRAAGLDAVALVDGETILPSAAMLADKLGVRYWVKPRAVA